MTPRGYRYYRREFLNRPGKHAGAYVLASINRSAPYGTVTIADCDRIVRLEFDGADASDRRNAIRKATVLIETLTDFRNALAESCTVTRR